jgi:hypothetical protein
MFTSQTSFKPRLLQAGGEGGYNPLVEVTEKQGGKLKTFVPIASKNSASVCPPKSLAYETLSQKAGSPSLKNDRGFRAASTFSTSIFTGRGI